MRYPSSLSSSIQKSPWNLFIVIPIPSWNGFQLFPKAVGKSFVSGNKKKSAIFVQLLLKSPQICEFLTACSANLKKMCINSNNEMSWKKWALYYRLHCTTKDIKSVPHTASCVREWPKQNIGTWQWIRRTFLFDYPHPFLKLTRLGVCLPLCCQGKKIGYLKIEWGSNSNTRHHKWTPQTARPALLC